MDIEESNECSVENAKARNNCKRTCNLCISNAVTEEGKKCRISYLALHLFEAVYGGYNYTCFCSC